MASHYEVLGVSQDASIEEIRRAYRARAQQFHPDSHPDASEERS
ncbi:MAG: DnaJ domain, partial [Actinomycetota bacterium]